MKKYLLLLCILCSLAELSGQVRIHNSYFDKNGRQVGPGNAFYFRQNTDTVQLYVAFYQSDSSVYFHGKIKAASDTSDRNNSYLGLCTWYYQNGAVKKEGDYVDGLPNGIYAEFYENGKPLKKVTYANGVLQGAYTEFYQNGRASRSATYEQGLLQGAYAEFYEDGRLSKQAVYNKGRPVDGRYTKYAQEGGAASVFSEDFLDNDNNWPASETEQVLCKVKIGGLQVLNNSGSDYSACIPFSIDSASFSIETTVNSNYITRDCRAGMLFGFKDRNNYQYFLVSQKTFYTGSVVNGVQSKHLDSIYASELSPVSWNKLKLVRDDDSLSVYINGNFKARYAYNYVPGDHIGFFVSRNGAALFDNLELKQYSKDHQAEPVTKETFILSGKRYPVVAHASGLVISKKGYVATPLPYVLHANTILIKAYVNDTLKLLTAKLDANNPARDLAVLKINDLGEGKLGNIGYSFLAVDHVPLEASLVAFCMVPEGNSHTYRISRSAGVLKSYACYENFIDNFESQFSNNNIGVGAALFTARGELVGMSQSWKKDRLVSVKAHLLHDLLFNSKEKLEVSKEKMEVGKAPKDAAVFEKEIYQNIVEVFVL